MKLVLVSGMSGSGKSVVLNALEDADFYCVDNLPLSQVPSLVQRLKADGIGQVAVAVDVRNGEDLLTLRPHVDALRAQDVEVAALLLTARTDVLIHRFSETRRRHPLSLKGLRVARDLGEATPLLECIEAEREIIEGLRGLGEMLDTSDLKAADLRALVRQKLQMPWVGMLITFQSFSFKTGIPLDSDLVFDVRCLPNPHYNPALRPLTGRDAPVAEFLAAEAEVMDMLNHIDGFLGAWLPKYQAEPRSAFTVSIGCTGGQHRSVYLVEQLAGRFANEFTTIVRHRALLGRPSPQG